MIVLLILFSRVLAMHDCVIDSIPFWLVWLIEVYMHCFMLCDCRLSYCVMARQLMVKRALTQMPPS